MNKARKDFAKVVSAVWKTNGIRDTLFPMISVNLFRFLAARQQVGKDLLPRIVGVER